MVNLETKTPQEGDVVKQKEADGDDALKAIAADAVASSSSSTSSSTLPPPEEAQTQNQVKANYPGEDPQSDRSLGLGSFCVLNDGMIQMFLVVHLEVPEICALNGCSKAWYAHTIDHELWRKVAMRSWNYQTGRFPWKGRWKETSITIRRLADYKARMEKEGKELDPNVMKEIEEHIPRYIPPPTPLFSFQPGTTNFLSGFNGMLMHRKWYRSKYPIDTLDLAYSHVERRSAKTMTLQQFRDEFEIPCKPVIITDMMDGWPASKHWNDEALLKRFGDRVFKMTHKHEGKRLRMKIADYFNYWRDQEDSDPLYLFESNFHEKAPEMADEYTVPFYFEDDLFKDLPKRPFHKWTIVGPARTGTSFHIDPLYTSAWNALIQGRKRWALYPPNWPSAPGSISLHPDDFFDVEVEPLSWLLEHYPFLAPEYKPWECVQRAGEVIFVPGGWWHMVLNLDETVAVTHNFVDDVNFPVVWGELDILAEGEDEADEDRILQEQWYAVLKEKRPELLTRVEYWKDKVEEEEEETKAEEVKPTPSTPRVLVPSLSLETLQSAGPQNWVEQPLEQIKIESSRDKKPAVTLNAATSG